MSQDNSYYGLYREVIDLTKSRYWYQLKFLPLTDSLKVKFNCVNNLTYNVFRKDWEYSYSTFEEEYYNSSNPNYVLKPDYKIVNVVCEAVPEYVNNGITYVSLNSTESQEYAKSLIGTTKIVGDQLLNITNDNYLEYIDFIINKTFIDFTISEKITNEVIDATNEDGSMKFPNMEITYFYELFK